MADALSRAVHFRSLLLTRISTLAPLHDRINQFSGQHLKLLYSWRFPRYRASIHWLVHGHMTSNNETVSRQMPWAGNISKNMTSNGKQFTIAREMLTAVARYQRWLDVVAGISARFSNLRPLIFAI